MERLSALTVLAVIAALVTPVESLACTCGGWWGFWYGSYPLHEAEGVPTNTLFWANDSEIGGENTLVVNVASGKEVPGSWSRIWLNDSAVLTFEPERGWSPITTYEVRDYRYPPEEILENGGQEALDAFLLRRIRFTTGEGPWEGRLKPPSATYELSHLGERGASLCHTGDYQVDIEFEAPHDGVLLVVDRDGFNTTTDDPPSTEPIYMHGTSQDGFLAGTGICGAPWPDASPGDVATFRFGVYDVTGRLYWSNNSVVVSLPDLGAPDDVPQDAPPAESPTDPPSPNDCLGCNQAAGRPSLLFGLLLFVGSVRCRRVVTRRGEAA